MTSGFAARTRRAPSRIGQIPTYGLPAASGASDTGFDSLNRTRKKPKFYPGQAKPKPPPGPGSRAAAGDSKLPLRLSIPPSEIRQQDAAAAGDGRHRRSASRRASASRSMTIRSARSAITPAAS